MNKITDLPFAKHQKKLFKVLNIFPSAEIFSKRRNIYVKSLSFINFIWRALVLSILCEEPYFYQFYVKFYQF